MNTRQISICLVSNNEERLTKYLNLLADPTNKITAGTFEQAFHEIFIEENPDLLILDITSYDNFDYRIIEPLRSQNKYANLPFVFLLAESQLHLVQQLYKVPHNRVLVEPVNKYLLISEINNSVHLNNLERRVNLYKDIVDGEKKLISYMDELLELNRLTELKTKVDVLNYLQTGLVKKLELALAVEMCVVGIYNEKKHNFIIQIFSQDGKEITKKFSISIKNSKIKYLLKDNYPLIFEKDLLSDPFVQEFEELLGYKISGMLVTPLVLLHQPIACFILINKLYRTDFSENDLAFTTIAAQKIVYHLELLEIVGKDESSSLLQNMPIDSVAKNSLLLEKVLSAVDFGLVIFDESQKIHYYNPASNNILRSKKTPANLQEMFDPNAFEQIEDSIQSGEFPVVRKEIHLHFSKESDFYIGYSIYTMKWDFNKTYYILVFSEISQTKRIQAEIIRMDRMASLGILSSGIAHEIRNPLAGIKAMAQNMEEELPKGSHTLEYVYRILRQVDRLDTLLRSFFSYAKPTRPDPKECHIKSIVDEALGLFTRKLREKNITVSQYYAKDLGQVFVDANQIQQVLINVILNGIQAMDSDGELNISADNAQKQIPTIDRRKRSPGLLSDKFIEISIKDSGTGFDDVLKEKIFNPFFTTKSSGTGLGLAIVYQIVREHGGQIDVDSEQGKGTTFKILLPASAGGGNNSLIS
ncbi:MAG: hypothetical protein D8M58_02620 [Calditrichaeota bacterium]|nr:MAG: hypothetical protein DWQ03_04460 [Calditrichota bacterium]MBL1204257.1 hypothetical protein [Calditrichota bacterium]NOG44087.1 hypothetical protein [Calditrichota bacterium]